MRRTVHKPFEDNYLNRSFFWQEFNSITHKVDTSELAAHVGTNKEYAAYVELGTGIYYPGGRKTPWAYVDDEGERHFTHGQKPQPYLKPAVTEHKEQYRNIIKNELRNG